MPFESQVHVSEKFLNPPDVGQLKMNLVRWGIARVVKTPDIQENGKNREAEMGLQKPDSAVYLNSGGSLLGGLRRNQSSVLMGSLGAPVCTSSPNIGILKKN
uniref:Uncharacterized protein n=1 Tax=Nannospalax galili TaxID=1026970 RepID=A0A8C6RIB5_NANGA